MYSNCFYLMAILLIINKDGFVAHVLHISLVATLGKYYLITTLKCNVILKIWQRLGLNASMYWIHQNYNICLPLVKYHNLDKFSAFEPILSKHVNFTSECGLPNMRGTFHETDLKRCFLLVSPKFCWKSKLSDFLLSRYDIFICF